MSLEGFHVPYAPGVVGTGPGASRLPFLTDKQLGVAQRANAAPACRIQKLASANWSLERRALPGGGPKVAAEMVTSISLEPRNLRTRRRAPIRR